MEYERHLEELLAEAVRQNKTLQVHYLHLMSELADTCELLDILKPINKPIIREIKQKLKSKLQYLFDKSHEIAHAVDLELNL